MPRLEQDATKCGKLARKASAARRHCSSFAQTPPCTLQYRSPLSPFNCCDMGHFSLLSFADTSTGHSSYGQTGFETRLVMRRTESWIYYVLYWHSSKQARVPFLSVGAEILESAKAADRSLLQTQFLSSLIGKRNLFRLVLTVNSYFLYSTISSTQPSPPCTSERNTYFVSPYQGFETLSRPTTSPFFSGFQVCPTSLTH